MTDDHPFPDRALAAERYLLGEMSDADRERYEEHFFSCADCADNVRTTAALLEDVKTFVAPRAAVPPARPLRSLFWPLPAGAALAAALLLSVLGYQAFSLAGLKRDLAAEQGLQSVPAYFLAASRSEGPTIAVSSGQRKIALTFSRSFDRPFPFYRCDVRSAGGQLVASAVLDAPAAGDELQILLPAGRLPPGPYTVAIAGLQSAAATNSPVDPALYRFTLRRDP